MHLPMPSSQPSWHLQDRRRVVNADGGFIEATYPWGSGERLPQYVLPPEWTLASSCIGSDKQAAALEHLGIKVEREAKAECAGCDVRDECLGLALRMEGDTPARMRFGIAGGLNPHERFDIFERSGTQPQAGAENVSTAPPEALSA